VKIALRKPRTTRSMGLSDKELAEALGISLKRLVDALNEAGLCRCPEKSTRQQAKAKKSGHWHLSMCKPLRSPGHRLERCVTAA
jgi:hypothetical protein